MINNTSHPLLKMPSHDRLALFLIIALGLHALIIFGLVFHQTNKISESTKTLAISLTTTKSLTEPELADFLSNHSNLGGGLYKQQGENQPPVNQLLQQTFDSVKQEQNFAKKTAPAVDKKELSTIIAKKRTVNNTQTPIDAEQTVAHSESTYHQQLLAELEQKLKKTMQAQAKRERRRTISSATKEARDAEYLEHWRKRIEQIGNLHYPDQARRSKLYGELRLLVAINKDGSLNEVQVRQSSGHKILDDAAINIVKIAAPFAPLSPAMQQDTDVLEIIRTWQFSSTGTTVAKRTVRTDDQMG